LKGYDYTQPGAYIVTLCTQDRACLFGGISDGEMRLNAIGRIVADEWVKTAEIRDAIDLDAWVVMPNHFHGILFIVGSCRGDRPVAPTKSAASTGPESRSVGAVIAGFKSAATKRINMLRGTPGTPVWQRNYHEHIIRDEESLGRIRGYILANPSRWAADSDNPFRTRPVHDCYG
jgi:REP element-mobilizing transposase RayT